MLFDSQNPRLASNFGLAVMHYVSSIPRAHTLEWNEPMLCSKVDDGHKPLWTKTPSLQFLSAVGESDREGEVEVLVVKGRDKGRGGEEGGDGGEGEGLLLTMVTQEDFVSVPKYL
ncbi:hypothetical protein D8674_012414 [Pyrus ussuriensis x Pyrus communis]|uniref:Uncharacterized protein n=1 Tax=Pyrus ussuriensis x Pyrus communis TaxID=2448454 RepID=A0A5N5G1J4_9ROSA|nr:hypothetical protein D8674_012414 [Pyrus ussuriensis x Pyrus communis]